MLVRNKEVEAKVRQSLATLFTLGQMAGGMDKLKIVGTLSAIGLQKVTAEWTEIEWIIQTIYDVINAVKGDDKPALVIN